MSDKEKLVTAYHESGHVLVGHVLPHADPIHKVSIVARSRSLGLTFTLPEDKYNHSRSELRDTMAMCLGGRSAEELIFDEPTTGAENDIEKATAIARAMVTEYGMSDVLGPQQLGHRQGEVFLGREFGHQPNYSEQVAASIDAEVRRLIDDSHDRARAILTLHRDTLDLLAAALVEKETLEASELMEIIGSLPTWSSPPPIGRMPSSGHSGASPAVANAFNREAAASPGEPAATAHAETSLEQPAAEGPTAGGRRPAPRPSPGEA